MEPGADYGLQEHHAPHSDIEQLTQAVLNEKNAPDILHFQQDVVDRLEAAFAKQESKIQDLESAVDQQLKRYLLTVELKRVRFLLCSYYRTRLFKIEKYASALMEDEEFAARLSEKELQYSHDYFLLLGLHLKNNVLQQLPPDWQSLVQVHATMSSGKDLIARPLLDTHVFCKVLADAGSVNLSEGQVVDMQGGDLYMLRYAQVAELVRRGQAVLV